MKVIVLNASPRKNNGNTALILNPFIEGMKDAGGVLVFTKFTTSRLTHVVAISPAG